MEIVLALFGVAVFTVLWFVFYSPEEAQKRWERKMRITPQYWNAAGGRCEACERVRRNTITEGPSKGRQNPPNISCRRPPDPKGSGGNRANN